MKILYEVEAKKKHQICIRDDENVVVYIKRTFETIFVLLSWNIDGKVPVFFEYSMACLNSTKNLIDLPINNFQLDDVSSKKNIPTFFGKAKNKWFYEKNDGKKGYDIICAFIIVYWGFIPLVTMLFDIKQSLLSKHLDTKIISIKLT